MVIRDHATFCFIPETLGFVQETQMSEILPYNGNFEIKLSFAQILIVTAIVCPYMCLCAHPCKVYLEIDDIWGFCHGSEPS